MNRVISKACLLVAAVTVAPIAVSTSADATPVVHCGATLAHSAALTHDLTCAAGDGITLAPNVTLDLRGHTLRGSGSGTNVGVTASFSGTDVIKNGRITDWNTGINSLMPDPNDGPQSSEGTVVAAHLSFDHNTVGVDASAGEIGGPAVVAFHIRDSSFSADNVGVRALVADVSVARSTFHDNVEALSIDSSQLVATQLRITRNQFGVTCTEAQCTLTKSVLRDNPTAIITYFIGGFTLSKSTITGSTLAYNGTGYAYTHTLTGNVFAHNSTAVTIDAGRGALADNVFRSNGTALTFQDASTDTPLTLTHNLLVHNGDAITVDDATGIGVGANLAVANKGWGIRVPNATDLGGNHAYHNGNSPQCIGVAC